MAEKFMLYYFFIVFMQLVSVSGYSSHWDDDEDDDFEYDESFTSSAPCQVTYAGMTIECDLGCGDSSSNSSFSEISSVIREATDRVFSISCSPIYLGWAPLEQTDAFPFHPWKREWPFKYKVYDWEKNKRILLI